MRTVQIPVEVPNDLRLNLYLILTGEAVLIPQPHFQATYENVPDGVSYFIDGEGLILWEKGSSEYEYNFSYPYKVAEEPLLKGFLRQLGLQNPYDVKEI